jgi:predicted DNA-binding transcriptional regulator AlpA
MNQSHPTNKASSLHQNPLETLPSFPNYLTTLQAADYLGVSHQFLEISRCKGGGPPFIKLARLVRYKKYDLDEWMDSHKQLNTTGILK